MRQRSDGRLSVLALLAAMAGAAPAQMQRAAPVTFQTPDGSRFVLAVDSTIPVLHWAIATPCDGSDDPPGLEGLTMAAMRASLGGTWRAAPDPAAERMALAALAGPWLQHALRPGDPAAAQAVRVGEQAAAQLGDIAAFARVLAAAPVHSPEIIARPPAAALVLTTLALAIDEVAPLLLERREAQALRGVQRAFQDEAAARRRRLEQDPAAPLHAEVLALLMPNASAARQFELPRPAAPSHDQALVAWASSQRPERTVQVLLGDFDPDAAERTLRAVFTTTRLPERPAPAPVPRPPLGERRSVIPGMALTRVAAAWPLPADTDRQVLADALLWLAAEDGGQLARELAAAGRGSAAVAVGAPWPPQLDAAGLLLVDAVDPGGAPGFGDAVVRACRSVGNRLPGENDLRRIQNVRQRSWSALAATPRRLAVELAVTALRWPDQRLELGPPPPPDGAAVQRLLAAVFGAAPVVVEGRP